MLSLAVTVDIKSRKVKVTGPRGTLNKNFQHMSVDIFKVDDKTVKVTLLPHTISARKKRKRRSGRQGQGTVQGCLHIQRDRWQGMPMQNGMETHTWGDNTVMGRQSTKLLIASEASVKPREGTFPCCMSYPSTT